MQAAEVVSSLKLLERYQSGEEAAVWETLGRVGAEVRISPLLEEAIAVCSAMAARARHNIEVLVNRLDESGFVFHHNDHVNSPVTPHIPPGDGALWIEQWLLQRFDNVPLTLSAWLREVGDVWLVGTHPRWPTSIGADPLVIQLEGSHYPGHSMTEVFQEDLEAQQYGRDRDDGDEVVLAVAPDRLHKDNVSGGPPYGFQLPDASADATFIAEAPMPFVAYLNHVFDNGGFPYRTGHPAEHDIKGKLASGLRRL